VQPIDAPSGAEGGVVVAGSFSVHAREMAAIEKEKSEKKKASRGPILCIVTSLRPSRSMVSWRLVGSFRWLASHPGAEEDARCVSRPLVSLVVALLVPVVFVAPACGPGEDPNDKCVTVSLDCKPIVSPPTFDALYTNIFHPSCALGTGSCHGDAVSAGLDMRTIDSAYAGLSKRVSPSSVGCSLLEKRVESSASDFRMPPGSTPLSEPQRCAIRQWIANGAAR
jgi:hypothetical protein